MGKSSSRGHSAAHPGFKAVAKQIAKDVKPRPGETKEEAANAILASRTRQASAAARRANPRLNRVKR